MSPLLKVDNLSFSYADRPILKGITLSMIPGEVVALLGPNGAGKTTLIRSLLGLLLPTGDVQWEGLPLRSWKRRDLARRVAYLPQSGTYDVGQTVFDVLRLGRLAYWSAFGIESPHDLQIVHEVADQLSLTDLLRRPMDELSGGQRQRVLVGRCLVQEPAALLLDEPNTYLDLRYQVELSELLHNLSREKNLGVLMASHDLNLAAAVADQLLLLHEGTIVASGTASEVFNAELLARVYGTPIERIDRINQPPVIIPRLSAHLQ